MKVRRWRGWALAGACIFALCVGTAAAQQDEGPILKPKAKPKPAGATLLVMCDLACDWKLDGVAQGRIEAGGSAKVKVELGQHLVLAVTVDGADQVKQVSEVKSSGQTLVNIELQPVRESRLKAEQEAREKAAKEAREKAAREQQERQAPAQAMRQPSIWKSDPVHSEVGFAINHMGISNVHGWFGTVDATIDFDENDVTKSTVNANIDVTGVSSGVVARDNHLKSDAFFDVSRFARATFVSTNVSRGGSGLRVSGNLTIHGVTKEVVLDVEGPSTPVTDMARRLHTGFSATTTINRFDFDIGPLFPDAVIGGDVRISINLDAVKQ